MVAEKFQRDLTEAWCAQVCGQERLPPAMQDCCLYPVVFIGGGQVYEAHAPGQYSLEGS